MKPTFVDLTVPNTLNTTLTMNTARTTLLIAILLSLPLLALGQECESETDEFTGNKEVSCSNTEVPIEEQPGETIYGAWAMAAKAEG